MIETLYSASNKKQEIPPSYYSSIKVSVQRVIILPILGWDNNQKTCLSIGNMICVLRSARDGKFLGIIQMSLVAQKISPYLGHFIE